MRKQYYQVTGGGAWMVDYPNGTTTSHRPGEMFQAMPSNKGVQRGLRVGKVRKLSVREENAYRLYDEAAAKKTPAPAKKAAKPASKAAPIVILPDSPPRAPSKSGKK